MAKGKDEDAIHQAAEMIALAVRGRKPLVVLTGAGISAESGVPTFRGPEGLWQGFRPEELATPAAFARDPERVWQWYHWRRQRVAAAEPNAGHRALVALEAVLDDAFTLLTQNVDGLHRRAGSQRVVELHGNLYRARCTRCQGSAAIPDTAEGLVFCPDCGSLSRPDVVWFGERLPEQAWRRAVDAVENASVMLVVGTSGVVQPAAGLVELAAARGVSIVEVNPQRSALTDLARCFIGEKAGVALPRLLARAGLDPASG
ncbi:MAG TPA: NAD-dependent deacylase [Bacillota bacterium]